MDEVRLKLSFCCIVREKILDLQWISSLYLEMNLACFMHETAMKGQILRLGE